MQQGYGTTAAATDSTSMVEACYQICLLKVYLCLLTPGLKAQAGLATQPKLIPLKLVLFPMHVLTAQPEGSCILDQIRSFSGADTSGMAVTMLISAMVLCACRHTLPHCKQARCSSSVQARPRLLLAVMLS